MNRKRAQSTTLRFSREMNCDRNVAGMCQRYGVSYPQLILININYYLLLSFIMCIVVTVLEINLIQTESRHMNDNKNLIVRKANVYGIERIYPVCLTSQLVARLIRQKTLDTASISILKRLGYTFEVPKVQI